MTETAMQTVTEDGEVVQANPAPLTLFGTDDPVAVVQRATAVATALADVLKGRKLVKRFAGNEYVLLEGWTLLGSMLGVFAQTEWTRPIEEGWEARAVAKTRNGDTVGSAEAMCTRRERTWSTRDDYAIRSMAQTRALAKALRMPLGFIVELAGYAATPAEEMPATDSEAGLPDIPDPQRAGLTRGQLIARIEERANEREIATDVLAELVSRDYDGRTMGDLSKDELIALGTAITHGKYDLPTDPTPDEQATSGSSEADASVVEPAMTPGSDLQAVLNLTGGELIEQPEAEGTPRSGEGREVDARRASGHPSRPTKDAAEAAQKAAARAVRVTP